MEFKHYSVLLKETIEELNIKPDGIYVDGTAGGAGHSKEIAKRLKSGMLYALDQDPDAVAVATERLGGLPAKVIKSNFSNMKNVLYNEGIEKVDGILLDLGVSSYQLDEGERGFSYHKDAFLDMRMSKEGKTAADLVNNLSVYELADIFRMYGEEKFAMKIAREIVKEREKEPIERTVRLAQIIANSVPAAARRDGHPARKCFQALRIAVNGELDVLKSVLDDAFDLLNKDGVLAIITFHSLEDLMVKHKFKEYTVGCTCPPDIPVCVCGKTPRGKVIHKKGIDPSSEELKENQRSRSAKLRTIIKL
jgi:16S rRNA (cytosine1402-N4)-methyltransferase